MRRPKILLVKPGTAGTAVHEAHGDFERWFTDAMGDADRFTVAEIWQGQPLPTLDRWDGVIVMGSPLSVVAPTRWMTDAADRLLEHAQAGGALLGVCFGHQLLSHGLGAPVILNPRGRELGSVRVQLTGAGCRDPLFHGLGPVLDVQAIHSDAASVVPPGATLLGSNEACPVQALAFGARARSVQFHPEATVAIARTVLAAEPGPERGDMWGDANDGRRILRNFEEYVVG